MPWTALTEKDFLMMCRMVTQHVEAAKKLVGFLSRTVKATKGAKGYTAYLEEANLGATQVGIPGLGNYLINIKPSYFALRGYTRAAKSAVKTESQRQKYQCSVGGTGIPLRSPSILGQGTRGGILW